MVYFRVVNVANPAGEVPTAFTETMFNVYSVLAVNPVMVKSEPVKSVTLTNAPSLMEYLYWVTGAPFGCDVITRTTALFFPGVILLTLGGVGTVYILVNVICLDGSESPALFTSFIRKAMRVFSGASTNRRGLVVFPELV